MMKKAEFRILITDKVHPHLVNAFEERGWKVDYQPEISYDNATKVIADYHGVIINSKIKANKYFLDKANNLTFIGRLGSGLEIIDQDYAKEKGVRVYNSPEGNCNAVAEHALGMLLSLFNKLNQADKQVKQFDWQREPNRGTELRGKTVGIIGFGHTGSSFARVLSGFGVEVLAYDKYKQNYTQNFEHVKESTPERIRQKADIISFHLPLTVETMKLVDQSYISQCKDGVYIINTSRGKVVHLKALKDALQSGKVAGACLDVFENEKFDQLNCEERKVLEELFLLNNIIVTPHIAGWTHQSLYKIADTLVRKVIGDLTDQH